MEVLFGITGKDFVLTAGDTRAARSIVVMKQGEDKSRDLNKNTILWYSGEPGDSVQFSEYIQRNVQLYGMRNGITLSTKGCANFTRREMAESLRSRSPYNVNVLIAGTDPKTGIPELYWIDYLASMVKVPFAAHGYASYFCLSTMDRYWHENLTLEEAKALLRKCIEELKKRFIVSSSDFLVKVSDRDGIRVVSLDE
ncbi:Proteasome subunit beta type-4 [Quaeritorhiza haematococci]|nr:Proteasome subunit beta type-4 [Quaeritorhiza haematococci]